MTTFQVGDRVRVIDPSGNSSVARRGALGTVRELPRLGGGTMKVHQDGDPAHITASMIPRRFELVSRASSGPFAVGDRVVGKPGATGLYGHAVGGRQGVVSDVGDGTARFSVAVRFEGSGPAAGVRLVRPVDLQKIDPPKPEPIAVPEPAEPEPTGADVLAVLEQIGIPAAELAKVKALAGLIAAARADS